MQALSKTTIYAIRALIYMLNNQQTNQYINIRDISNDLDISFHFLTKILQSLTKQGLLSSYRGATGGIAISKNPQNIRLIDLIYILEGNDFFDKCLLGLPGCGTLEPCPAHEIWSVAKDDLKMKFENASILDLKNLKGRITNESLELATA
ncbi:MAG: Rrf2 family transcriptional regulator [Cytophagales bacterium]|nr:Rrf2 family transcriptional regulator [Cytophagales bacterium]